MSTCTYVHKVNKIEMCKPESRTMNDGRVYHSRKVVIHCAGKYDSQFELVLFTADDDSIECLLLEGEINDQPAS